MLNTLRPRQNGRHFADDIFKCIFLTENVWIAINISLKFVPKVQINNIPASVQIMDWRQPGDKPLSEPMMLSLLTHICLTRPQWVNKVVITVSTDGLALLGTKTSAVYWWPIPCPIYLWCQHFPFYKIMVGNFPLNTVCIVPWIINQ